ncbi:MAG: hypothetical protein KGV43_02440 [Arcobacter sp.]|nr:hypothetical protein [Arcobacter sp.]
MIKVQKLNVVKIVNTEYEAQKYIDLGYKIIEDEKVADKKATFLDEEKDKEQIGVFEKEESKEDTQEEVEETKDKKTDKKKLNKK